MALTDIRPMLTTTITHLPRYYLYPYITKTRNNVSPRDVPRLRHRGTAILLLNPNLNNATRDANHTTRAHALIRGLLPNFTNDTILSTSNLGTTTRLLTRNGALPRPTKRLVIAPRPNRVTQLAKLSITRVGTSHRGATYRCTRG